MGCEKCDGTGFAFAQIPCECMDKPQDPFIMEYRAKFLDGPIPSGAPDQPVVVPYTEDRLMKDVDIIRSQTSKLELGTRMHEFLEKWYGKNIRVNGDPIRKTE